MMTRNPHIRFFDLGNLYSIEGDIKTDVYRAIVHFQRRYGKRPTAVLLHPDNIDGLAGTLTITHEKTGEVYQAHVLADAAQQKSTFTVISDGKDGE